MIDAGQAVASAAAALTALRDEGDSLLAAWHGLSVEGPALVHDVRGPPSYWLVAIVANFRVVGFVRVAGDGAVMAIGMTCRGPADLDRCPRIVTGLTAEEARAQVLAATPLAADEALARTVFVHDGPPGREAWLVESARAGRALRWFFVTRGGIYHRAAGERHGTDASLQ